MFFIQSAQHSAEDMLVCAFCFLVFGSLSLSDNASTEDHFDVIIIGAGISGLSAAEELLLHDVTNIKIIESTGRVGGRMISIPNHGKSFVAI